MTIGVLALQGDFDAHRRLLQSVAADAPSVSRVVEVREAADLTECDGLIIPGGESTTMSRLCDRYGLWEPLRARLNEGMGALGTCAGMILLAQNIEGATSNFAQRTLGALDIDVARNAYGAQLDSFEADIVLQTDEAPSGDTPSSDALLNKASNTAPPGVAPLRAVFIRAPRITRCGPDVEVLARHDGAPVAVQQGRVVVAAFHPEIAGDTRLHVLWLRSLKTGNTRSATAEAVTANAAEAKVTEAG